jgi:hypothetical protein
MLSVSVISLLWYVQEFDESQDMAGKPIPGFLCRVATPERKEKSFSLYQLSAKEKKHKITRTGRIPLILILNFVDDPDLLVDNFKTYHMNPLQICQ